jgi:hypothetical protein
MHSAYCYCMSSNQMMQEPNFQQAVPEPSAAEHSPAPPVGTYLSTLSPPPYRGPKMASWFGLHAKSGLCTLFSKTQQITHQVMAHHQYLS